MSKEIHDEWCDRNGCRCGKCPCAKLSGCQSDFPVQNSKSGDFPVEKPVPFSEPAVFPVGISGLQKFLVWMILAVISWAVFLVAGYGIWVLYDNFPVSTVCIVMAVVAGIYARIRVVNK